MFFQDTQNFLRADEIHMGLHMGILVYKPPAGERKALSSFFQKFKGSTDGPVTCICMYIHSVQGIYSDKQSTELMDVPPKLYLFFILIHRGVVTLSAEPLSVCLEGMGGVTCWKTAWFAGSRSPA